MLGSTKVKNLAQAEWHTVQKIREDLKAMLPMIPLSETKRFHLQHDDAIIDELKEKGLQDEADFVKELVKLDEDRKYSTGLDTATWNKSRLKNQEELLNHLKEALIIIGNSKKLGETVKATNTWIKISLFFQSKGKDWWWLTKRLYQEAFKEARSITGDDEQNITIVRYLYGRFLFTTETDWLEALKVLDAARETSEKRIWNISQILGEKQETIFRESCALIYKILLTLVKKIGHEDLDFAMQACNEALQRAKETGHDDYVINALYESGRNRLRYGDVKHALQEFSRVLAMAKRIPDFEGICNAHMELAFAYKEIDDIANTEKHLSSFRESAAQFNLPYKLAQAHYYTGEHFLSQMKAYLATAHLMKSFTLYYDLGSLEEADRARIITGISRGQEKIDKFIDLLIQCGKHSRPTLLKICAWKSNRNINWAETSHDTATDDFHEYCEDSTYPMASISDNLLRNKYK